MVAWEIKGMGGVTPRTDNRLINDNMAVEAVNCDLTGGKLLGLPNAVLLADLAGRIPIIERAYRVGLPVEHPPVQNVAPTIAFSPVITGTGIVGQPLHCDTGRWNNVPTAWTGAWYRDGSTQVGTDFVYYVQAADRGHSITCQVTASNSYGTSAPATSNAIAIALPADSTPPVNTRAPIISGSGAPGFNLHCDLGLWINSPATYICQWLLDGGTVLSSGTPNTDYLVQPENVGHDISTVVLASNQYGTAQANPSNIIHIPVPGGGGVPPPPPGDVPAAYGAPNITGNPTPGYQLFTNYGQWNNTPESYSVEWFRDAVSVLVSPSAYYNVVTADIGHTIRCVVTATNIYGSQAGPISNGVFIPVPVTPPFCTVQPFITGVKLPNYRLSSDNGAWAYTPTSFVINWYKDATLVKSNSSFYDVVDADKEHDFYTIVTATNSFGSVPALSNTVHINTPDVPIPSTPPVNTVAPWIYGDGQGGNTLRCDLGTWIHFPANYLAQWISDGSTVLQSGYADITTGSFYTTSYYDIGHVITCNVIAGNSFGQTTSLPSNQVSIYGYGRSLDPPPLPIAEPLAAPRSGPAVAAQAAPTQQDSVWLPLPSRFSSVVRSPLANDRYHRIYWTNPGDYAPHFTTTDRLKSGIYSWLDLGIVTPLYGPAITSVTGGTAGVDEIERAYVFTYINEFGEESAPSPPSEVVSGLPDAVWHLAFPSGIESPPLGLAYPTITLVRMYRTITSTTTGAQFYQCGEWGAPDFPPTYDDSAQDKDVVGNKILETSVWGNPPPYLDGLVAMPGGFMVGFTGNTLHFSEPDRPHAWPSTYDLSVHYDIISIVVWQQYLIVLTNGYPSAGSGNMPSNIVMVPTQVNEPCVSRGSIIVDMTGVYYASINGLIQFTGYGIQNITAGMVEKDKWVTKYRATKLFSCRHRTQFLSVNETHGGFIIDYAEPRLSFQDLTYMKNVVCVWNDEYTGETLMCTTDGKIWQWDVPGEVLQTYRWKSKQFFTPVPLNLGAAQVELDRQVLAQQPPDTSPLNNGDASVSLPAGVNAQFRYYAGPTLQLIMTRNLTKQMEIFRLPTGFKAFDHQVEIVSRVPVSSIQLAQTLEELKTV